MLRLREEAGLRALIGTNPGSMVDTQHAASLPRSQSIGDQLIHSFRSVCLTIPTPTA